MNIQAFNKDTNKIRTEDEYGQILWEDIKYIKPIDKSTSYSLLKWSSSCSIDFSTPLRMAIDGTTIINFLNLPINSCIIRFTSWILMVHIRKI